MEGQALRYIKDSQKLMVGEIHIDIDNFKFFFKFIYLFMYSLLPSWGSNSRLCEIKSYKLFPLSQPGAPLVVPWAGILENQEYLIMCRDLFGQEPQTRLKTVYLDVCIRAGVIFALISRSLWAD